MAKWQNSAMKLMQILLTFERNHSEKNLKIKILDERKECESNIEKYPCQKKNWIKKGKKKQLITVTV